MVPSGAFSQFLTSGKVTIGTCPSAKQFFYSERGSVRGGGGALDSLQLSILLYIIIIQAPKDSSVITR